MNALTQMIQRRQMFAPMIIQALQHDGALELAHHFTAGLLFFGKINSVRGLDDAFAQGFFMQIGVFFQPFLHRQFKADFGF